MCNVWCEVSGVINEIWDLDSNLKAQYTCLHTLVLRSYSTGPDLDTDIRNCNNSPYWESHPLYIANWKKDYSAWDLSLSAPARQATDLIFHRPPRPPTHALTHPAVTHLSASHCYVVCRPLHPSAPLNGCAGWLTAVTTQESSKCSNRMTKTGNWWLASRRPPSRFPFCLILVQAPRYKQSTQSLQSCETRCVLMPQHVYHTETYIPVGEYLHKAGTPFVLLRLYLYCIRVAVVNWLFTVAV